MEGDKKRFCVLDIESSGLLSEMLDFSSFPYKLKKDAELWCVVVRDVYSGEEWSSELSECTYDWMKKVLAPFNYIIAHNGIKFDWPTLSLFGILDYTIGFIGKPDTCFGKEVKFIDTLILSRLSDPTRVAHSLKHWGMITKQPKDDYRQQCINAGFIEPNSPKGEEFRKYNNLMLPYCKQDCKANAATFKELLKELSTHDWKKSIKVEHKLADLAIKRESLGFKFDKKLAIECVAELENKMQELSDKVLPNLPMKPMNQSELDKWTPPKNQLKKDGSLSTYMINFIDRIGAYKLNSTFNYEGEIYKIPHTEPIRTELPPKMKDLDHIKMHLISLGWIPTEWAERDLTKDSKKISIPYEKRVEALDRWWKDTTEKGKYSELRFKQLGVKRSEAYEHLKEKLNDKWPVRIPTSPKITVGIQKDICPNLLKLGDSVAFAKDFSLWLTYRHRRNSIAGGDISELDLSKDKPETGFLSMYRESDGRVPTPSIEIGAVTNRFRHIGVANIARPSSVYGRQMRSLFGCGEGAVQLGFDYSSLENRVQGHYIHNYSGGPELAKSLIAEKPNDLHTLNAKMLGISRGDVKSFTYAVLYGSAAPKISKMLGVSISKGKELIENFWDGNPPLKNLKIGLEKHWNKNNKKWIRAIDNRKINTRSKHSLLNALFQSGGVIFAKYAEVFLMEELEEKGFITSPFEGVIDVCTMISYHDEQQLYVDKKHVRVNTFEEETDAEKFIEDWKGEQLSGVGEVEKYYVGLPNEITKSITSAIKKAEEYLKINVEMGYEWDLGKNWYHCH